MAAEREEEAQTPGLKLPKLSVKSTPIIQERRSQESARLPSVRKDAQWKETFYEKVQQRARNLQREKVEKICVRQAEEEKVKKKEPLDWLSKEWFCREKMTRDTRAYLLDKLLPTLVPGVEKLLMEVERKKVLETDQDPPKFDPINFLGEYLMRHNPQFDISAKPGPYKRGMKAVMEELKTQVPDTALNRLAKMKSEIKKNREQREQVEKIKSQVREMRKEALAVQFKDWTLDISGRIPLALVQGALRSFLDVVSTNLGVGLEIYDRQLETTDTLGKKVNEEQFMEYVYSYIKTFTSGMFQEFLKHLCQCADAFQDIIRHDTWRQMFIDLFLDCDHGKLNLQRGLMDSMMGLIAEILQQHRAGLLDRQRTLALLEDFYDSSPVVVRRGFCNPRQWPIIELQEIELTEFWGDLDDRWIASEEPSQIFALSQTEVSEGRTLSSKMLAANGQALYETCIVKEEIGGPETEQDQVTALEQKAVSESGTDENDKEEPSLIGEPGEIVKITALREEHVASPGSEVQVNQDGEGLIAELYATGSAPTLGEDYPISEEETGRDRQVSQKGLHVTTKMEEADPSPHLETTNPLLEKEASEAKVSQEVSKSGSRKGSTAFKQETTSIGNMDTEKQYDTADPESQNGPIPAAAPEIDKECGSAELVIQEEHNVFTEPSELILAPDLEDENTVLVKGLGSEAQVYRKEHDLTEEPNGAAAVSMPEGESIISEEGAVSKGAISALIPKYKEETAELRKEEIPESKESGSEEQGRQSGLQARTETAVQAEDSTPRFAHEQTLLQDQSTGPSHPPRVASQAQASEPFGKAAQLIDRVPWSGDLLASDLIFKYSSYSDQIPEDWNNENFRFADLRMIMADIQTRDASLARSAFDNSCLNLPQFVQLLETFAGEHSSLPTVKKLVAFIKKGYVQTEEEKIKELEKVHREALLARRRLLLEALFEKWDNECSGFLDLKDVDAVLETFKEGMEKEALRKAKKHLPCSHPHPSGVVKLSPKEFQTYLELVVSELTGNEEEALENMVEFLTMSMQWTHTERLRGSARRKWLHSIQRAAETSGASKEAVYKAVFRALSQDAEAHGNNKKVSAYIALLEQNQLSPARRDILLRYVACTSEDAPYILNQALYRDMKGVSFAAAEEGKPVHIPRVQFHGNIHFWNYDRPEQERRGSLLVLPLKDSRWRVFGILGVDTMRDQCDQTIFLTHEITFYQGISHVFSKAYHHVRLLENILQVAHTAVSWLHVRAPTIHDITMYLAEPGKDQMGSYVLRKMMTTDHCGHMEIPSPPTVLCRKENIFRDYLFKCIGSSEVISTFTYGEPHIAVPLREPTGRAFGVFDLSPVHYQGLPPHEHRDLQKMLKMAQAAFSEILKESSGDTDPTYVLAAEHVADWKRAQILFYRLMLQDVCECVQKLDAESFADIKSYTEPPAMVQNIVKAVLLLFYPEWIGLEKTENWSYCVLKLDGDLIQKICCFDPTAAYVQVQMGLLADCIKGIPREEVWKHGSVPIEYLYNWALTCLTLIELTKEIQHTQDPSSVSLTPRPSLITKKSTEFLLSANPSDSVI